MALSSGLSFTLRSYCSGASIWLKRASSCASPHVPRSFTLENTRLISCTLPERLFISPTLSYIFSSRSLTRAKLSESLPSIEEVSLSSTERRIRSRFCALVSTIYLMSSFRRFCMFCRRCSVLRLRFSAVRALKSASLPTESVFSSIRRSVSCVSFSSRTGDFFTSRYTQTARLRAESTAQTMRRTVSISFFLLFIVLSRRVRGARGAHARFVFRRGYIRQRAFRAAFPFFRAARPKQAGRCRLRSVLLR